MIPQAAPPAVLAKCELLYFIRKPARPHLFFRDLDGEDSVRFTQQKVLDSGIVSVFFCSLIIASFIKIGVNESGFCEFLQKSPPLRISVASAFHDVLKTPGQFPNPFQILCRDGFARDQVFADSESDGSGADELAGSGLVHAAGCN